MSYDGLKCFLRGKLIITKNMQSSLLKVYFLLTLQQAKALSILVL